MERRRKQRRRTHELHRDELSVDGDERPRTRELFRRVVSVLDKVWVSVPVNRGGEKVS